MGPVTKSARGRGVLREPQVTVLPGSPGAGRPVSLTHCGRRVHLHAQPRWCERRPEPRSGSDGTTGTQEQSAEAREGSDSGNERAAGHRGAVREGQRWPGRPQ